MRNITCSIINSNAVANTEAVFNVSKVDTTRYWVTITISEIVTKGVIITGT